MINVSSEFRSTMQERTDFRCHAEITLANGTVLEPTDNDFCIGGNSITDGAGCNGFPLGIAISRSITIELMNDEGQYADVDFFGAKIRLYLTFALSQTTERVEMGTFTVIDPEDYGSTVKITAVDGMYHADRPWQTSLTFPTTIGAMYREICDACDISVGSARFRNDGFVVDAAPEGDYSYRQMLGAIAMIAVGNARISRLGYMEILPYNPSATAAARLSDWASPLKVDTDNIVITGISTEQQTDGESETVMSGEEGYVISVENPLCPDKSELVGIIAGVLVGFSFRKFDSDYIANPLIEAQDVIDIVDRKGTVYRSFATDISFTFGGMTTLCNSSDSVIRNGAKGKYATPENKATTIARKLVEQEKSAREQAIEQLESQLMNGSGMYSTDALQPDGSTIRYLHDKPTLEESANVIKVGSDAIGFSTDGGETYPYGIAINGDTITRILSAVGIQAEWVNIRGESIVTYTETLATKEELEEIELTPGPPGKDGQPGQDGQPGKDGSDGDDGISIVSVVSEYCLSASDSDLTAAVEYVDDGYGNLTVDATLLSDDGEGNLVIDGITVVDDGDGNLTLTGSGLSGWQTDVPTITGGMFLWQRDRITYSDGSVTTTTPWCLSKGVNESVSPRITEAVEISKQTAAAIVEDSQSVMLKAMSTYTEKSTFEQYQLDLSNKLQVLDEGIEARVSRTEISEITTAQGDVQRRVNTIEKFIKFDADDGVTIGQEGSNIKQVLDNDSQKIVVNGQVVQELNAKNGAQYTSVNIKDRLRLGNLIIYVEPDGSLAGRRAN